MLKIYYDKDADLNLLKGKKIAIIGYGNQGRAQSLNLRDSGCDVVVSELEGTPNYEQAVNDGFKPVPADAASRQAKIVQILTQDHLQARIYKNYVEKNMTDGIPQNIASQTTKFTAATLYFSSLPDSAKNIPINNGSVTKGIL